MRGNGAQGGAGQLNRRVTLQQRGLDANGDRLGDWVDVVTRDARIVSLTGGETVKTQRLEGDQPVVIYVRRDSLTKQADNAWRAVDARDASTTWGVTSSIWNRETDEVELLAVQRRNGSDA